MDDEENDGSQQKPGTSHDNMKKPGTSHDNARKDKRRDQDCDSQSSGSNSSIVELKIKDQKAPAPHLGTKKMRVEKKVKKRKPVGRVEKRRKGRARYKRRPAFAAFKVRAASVSTEDSRRSDSPRPKCKYCGHRCCMQRNDSWDKKKEKNKKRSNSKARRSGKASKKMSSGLSECNQTGSRCTMLSPLFISCSASPQEEPSESSPRCCEITPQMIHHAVEELTMRRESVPSGAILAHLQKNYPVNPNVEEAATELANKLFVANLIGIVWALPNDYWRLATALENANKLEERHVTLFWRMYADTMRPLDINRKSRLTRRDAQTGLSQNQKYDTKDKPIVSNNKF